MHFKQILQLLLRNEVRTSVFFLKNEAVALVRHQEGILPEGSSTVFDTMARKVKANRFLH